MATGTRVYYNLERGTLNASLTASTGDTTIDFGTAPGFATLNAGEYISITLNDDTSGAEEIVHLTSYTAAATTGTIERAQEGSTLRAHSATDSWAHTLTKEDVEQRVTGAFSGVRLLKTATQSIANNTITQVTWAAGDVEYDTDNYFDDTNDDLVAPVDGYYFIGAATEWASNSTGDRIIGIYKGASLKRWTRHNADLQSEHHVSTVLKLDAGDTINIRVYQTSGGALDCGGTGSNGMQAEMHLVRSTGSAVTEFIGASLYTGAAQSVATSTVTTATFDNAEYDSHGFFDDANDRLTIPAGQGGKYLVQAGCQWAANASGERMLNIDKNGGGVGGADSRIDTNTSGNVTEQTTLVVLDLVAGDYIDLEVYQNSGGALNVANKRLSITKLGQARIDADPVLTGDYVGGEMVKDGTNQTLTTATAAKVTWDTAGFDTAEVTDLTNNQFAAPVDGKYLLTWNIEFAANGTGRRIVLVEVNDALFIQPEYQNTGGSGSPECAGSVVLDLTAGDTVHLEAYQDSGGNLDLVASARARTTLSLIKPGAKATTFIGAKVMRTTAFAVSSATFTTLNWDATADYDSHGFYDGTDEFVIPAGQSGQYLIVCQSAMSSAGSGSTLLNIRKNNTGSIAQQRADDSSTGNVVTTAVIDLVEGDRIDAEIYVDAGSDFGPGFAGQYPDSFFSITKLGMAEPATADASEAKDVNAAAGATPTVNVNDAGFHVVTLTAAATFTFTAPTDAGKAWGFTILLKQDGTGGWGVTWPAAVQWDSGTAPTLTTTANSVSMLTFVTDDGGTTWYGALVGDAFA